MVSFRVAIGLLIGSDAGAILARVGVTNVSCLDQQGAGVILSRAVRFKETYVGIDYRQHWRRPKRWGAVGGDLTGLAIVLTVAGAVAVLGGCSCRLSAPPASSSPEAMAARIRQVADGLPCASMTVTVAADGAIQVSGFVSGAESPSRDFMMHYRVF
jgi:hypothetical protein